MISFRYLSCVLVGLLAVVLCGDRTAAAAEDSLRGALLAAQDVTDARIGQLASAGTNAIVVALNSDDIPAVRQAAAVVEGAQLDLYYWIEVARCPELADRHPQWMASQQTHPEWRRLFPQAPQPQADEVVKTYPWVPILSKETFPAQLDRVRRLLASVPAPTGVFLNDLQGAPSACGCGNSLCRWTSDYGKRRTTIPLGDEAAAMFVEKVAGAIPGATVIPVWATECEQHDGAKDGLCAGVGCFDGICWRSWSAQLAPIERTRDQLGLLVPYKAFGRDVPFYQGEAAWIGHAVAMMDAMPRKYNRAPVKSSRLITVLQGWDVSEAQIQAQIRIAEQAEVSGYIVSYWEIDQSWQPRLAPAP
jgi:hypothetical protein